MRDAAFLEEALQSMVQMPVSRNLQSLLWQTQYDTKENAYDKYCMERTGTGAMEKRYLQEKELLKRLNAGLMDGLIGEGSERVHLTSQALIKDGRPMLVKYLTEKGPVEEAMIIEKEFVTDEGKLWFLRNHGWVMEDVHAQLYSRIFKRAGSP